MAFIANVAANIDANVAWVIEWLNNSPDVVLNYLQNCGEQMRDFLIAHHATILKVLSYTAQNYGIELGKWLLANGQDALVALVNLVDKYDEDAWDLVKIYLNACCNGEYTVTEDSYYVAITGNSNLYAQMLADYLQLGNGQFTILGNELTDIDSLANLHSHGRAETEEVSVANTDRYDIERHIGHQLLSREGNTKDTLRKRQ